MGDSASRSNPVGVIGIGLMGAALTERLLDGGYSVVVHNRTRDKAAPLVARGAKWSDNPLAECERVVISLYSTDVVESVLRPMERSLRPGLILIDTTTGDPQRMAALGAYFAERGVQYLETPISGSSEQTRRRLSTALAAGPREAFIACQDLLECLAAKTFYVGAWGNGVRMKLVTNLVLGLNRAVLAEGLVFAKAVGLDPQDALHVLLNSPAYSRTMDAKGPKMVNGDFTPHAKLSQHIKDVELILDEAARSGKSLPLSQLHLQLLERAEAEGFGELDNSVIINAIDENLISPFTSPG
ncbi:MAG: NAD(P)-dependent oxidoreductase [Planctomycetota bacterium]|nr:MAG: NAD(P)-dependent oxidoreductase [Planctomycetota bacterium]